MKRVIVVIFAMTFLAANAKASVSVTKSSGGPDGYYSVGESHTSTPPLGGANDVLLCFNPGKSKCEWVIEPSCDILKTDKGAVSITNVIEPDVENQLNKGVKSGSMLFSPYIVTWNGTDAYNYELTIDLKD